MHSRKCLERQTERNLGKYTNISFFFMLILYFEEVLVRTRHIFILYVLISFTMCALMFCSFHDSTNIFLAFRFCRDVNMGGKTHVFNYCLKKQDIVLIAFSIGRSRRLHSLWRECNAKKRKINELWLTAGSKFRLKRSDLIPENAWLHARKPTMRRGFRADLFKFTSTY